MTQPRLLLGGRYELDGVVGRGGMAEVYRARDLRLDRVVAVKTLRSDLARDPTFLARFRREAQSAASLNHPSVIAVYDTGEDAIQGLSIPYIVMEYADGRTLRDLLRDDQRLPTERAMQLVDGILRALDYSHRGGIVHRDIKPANVMLTSNGEVKVMDFGIARAMADSAATMTQTAQVIGTAQYLSPEQARGERVDARSDIYSTGCVLYELMTGRPPFQGDSPVAIAYQHVREEPIPPSHIDPSIPRWADAIAMKALAKDPNIRYQSAAEFRGDIQRAMQGMPVAASTMAMSATRTRLDGEPASQRTRVATGYGDDLPPVDYDEPEEPEGRGKRIAIWTLVAVLVIAAAGGIGYLLIGGNGSNNNATMPSDLIGSTQSQATTELEQLGIPAGHIQTKQQFSTAQQSGYVFQVDPTQGATINKSTGVVTLYVSKGTQTAKIPSVNGDSVAEATQTLNGAGFKSITQLQQPSSTVPKGTVIRTDPRRGTTVPTSTQITLLISSGQTTSPVPNVVGQTLSDAEANLKNAGFTYQIQQQTATQGQTIGTVLAQSIAPNTQEPPHTTVIITVATAPTTTPSSPGASPGPSGF
jgi:serine/threonine-protein kinase